MLRPGNTLAAVGITVPPLTLCKEIVRPGFATWHGKVSSRKHDAPSRVHTSALVWSIRFKIGHIKSGSLLDGWQQWRRNLVGNDWENHSLQTGYFHKAENEGQCEVTTRVQKGVSRGLHLPCLPPRGEVTREAHQANSAHQQLSEMN